MAFPKSKGRRLIVDDMPYVACVSKNGYTKDGGVRLRVTVRAEYGFKSPCIVAGMVNRDVWLDFPNVDPANTFSITPRVTCELIRYALANDWLPLPTKSKAQTTVQIDNDGLFAMMRRIETDFRERRE